MDTVLHDIRYTLRGLARNPGFTLAATLTLALAVGATTATFGVLDRAVLRPLAVEAPERLVQVAIAREDSSGAVASISWNLSYPGFTDLRDRAGVFSGVLAHSPVALALRGAESVERLDGAGVSAGFFGTLGVHLPLGRDILPDEDRPGAPQPVVVLSHGLWQRRFGGTADVLDRVASVNGRPYTVIGVAPASFTGLVKGGVEDAWVPITTVTSAGDNPFGRRTVSWLNVMARLAPGVARGQAVAALGALGHSLRREGLVPAGQHFHVQDGSRGLEYLVGDLRRPLTLLLAAATLVLLIACANVAGLLLARAAARRREMAVRVSLGARRARLVRQLVTEGGVLAALGAGGGLFVALWLGDLMPAARTFFGAPLEVGRGLDLRVVAFTAAAAAVTAMLFAVLPALRSSRPDLVGSLKEGAPTDQPGRRIGARDLLVVGQVALSLVLLASAGLLARTARNLRAVDPGYDPRGVLLAGVDLEPRGLGRERVAAFWDQLIARLAAQPGVEAASVALTITPSPGGSRWDEVPLEGYTPTPERPVEFDVNVVGADYFRVFRIPLLRGRAIAPTDGRDGARVAVVNETMARRYWPGQEALGRRIFFGADTTAPAAVIVGIARDGKYRSLREEPTAVVYLSAVRSPLTTGTLILRSRTDPAAFAVVVRREVRALDPELPLTDVRTLDEHLALATARERLLGALATVFAVLGVALAAVGLFGLLAFLVARRTREIGVRMALGAEGADVVRMVVGRGLARAGLGIGVGLAAALATSRLLRSLLYGVGAVDPVSYVGAAAILLAVAALAAWIPARRAARIDPMEALRYE